MNVAVSRPSSASAPEQCVTPTSMVERMTLVLEAFERRSARLKLEEVAARTQLPRSTVHRILEQLVKLQWLGHTDDGYGLGRRVLGAGGQNGTNGEIREAAAPLLHELHLRTGMVVHLAVLDGADEIFLDKIGGRFASGLQSKVGGRSPAYRTTGGRAMLACLPPEDIDAMLSGRLSRPRRQNRWDLESLHEELNRIRGHRGLSFDRGGRAPAIPGMEIPSVAAAIRGPQGPVAAICLCAAPKTADLELVAPLLGDAVARIAQALFPR